MATEPTLKLGPSGWTLTVPGLSGPRVVGTYSQLSGGRRKAKELGLDVKVQRVAPAPVGRVTAQDVAMMAIVATWMAMLGGVK